MWQHAAARPGLPHDIQSSQVKHAPQPPELRRRPKLPPRTARAVHGRPLPPGHLLQSHPAPDQPGKRACAAGIRTFGGRARALDPSLAVALPPPLPAGLLSQGVTLPQAHLPDSARLEEACLSFICRTLEAVVNQHGAERVEAAVGSER